MSADSVTEPVPVAIPSEHGPGCPGLLWLPRSGHGPGVVVVHEIFGLSDYIRTRCADLAAAGYVVLAPDLYARLDPRVVDESRPDFLQQAMELMAQVDWDTAVAEVRGAVAFVRSRPEVTAMVAEVGFCFGGGLAYAAAAGPAAPGRADLLVSYYGSALPQLVDSVRVEVPSLHHFGLADAYIPAEEVSRIRQAVAAGSTDLTFRTYPGAGHAFDNPLPVFHDQAAAEQAWQTTLSWLHDHLPVG